MTWGVSAIHAYRFMVRADVPYPIRHAFRKAVGDPTPERMLWRAVIARTIVDAYGRTGLEDVSEHRTAVREAREFWHKQGPYFDLVFESAGINPLLILPFMVELDPALYYRKSPAPTDKPLDDKLVDS